MIIDLCCVMVCGSSIEGFGWDKISYVLIMLKLSVKCIRFHRISLIFYIFELLYIKETDFHFPACSQ